MLQFCGIITAISTRSVMMNMKIQVPSRGFEPGLTEIRPILLQHSDSSATSWGISTSSPDIILRYQHRGYQQLSDTIDNFVLYFYYFCTQIYHEMFRTFLHFLCPTLQFLPLSLSPLKNSCKYCMAVIPPKFKDPKFKSKKSAMP